MNKLFDIFNSIKENKKSAFFYTPIDKGDEKSYIFEKPSKTLFARSKEELNKILPEIDSLVEKFDFAFGYLSYEAGYLLEEKLGYRFDFDNKEIIKFNFFISDSVEAIPTKNISFNEIEKFGNDSYYSIHKPELNETKSTFLKNVNRIKEYIANGDTYQVNYTLKTKFNFEGDISAFAANLIFNQSANYTAFINTGDSFIISISPELFFKTKRNTIISKPMKGTIKRGRNIPEDILNRNELKDSLKDRAENIMIVDLLRNDIGKICEFNSVKADPIFKIEKYETLFQMTSTVKGKLREKSFSKIIKNLFPCGSITGAPKIRTMEIINELEKEPRGIYTGAIGIIKQGDYSFNIPIRTITIDKKGNSEMGIGSGIVWDSNPEKEFEETILKSNFLLKQRGYFELIETMLIDNGEIFLLENHIARLKNSADFFLFRFDENKLRLLLSNVINGLDLQLKFRLKILLTKWGEFKYSYEQIPTTSGFGKIILSDKRTDSENPFQYFKTTQRGMFNSEYEKYKNEFDDVIFMNERGEITEGAISNIAIFKEGRLITPPVSSGLLNGCYREKLIKSGKVVKSVIFKNDLLSADEIYIFNSVRKMRKVELSLKS